MICVLRYYPGRRTHYNILTTVVVNALMVGWLIYGNMLYFSDKNNCLDDAETKDLANLMLFFIIIGYVQMVFLFLLIFVLPCKRDALSNLPGFMRAALLQETCVWVLF